MNEYSKILEGIGGIKIQGAESVARAGIKAFLLEPTATSAERIISARPTEPLLHYSINRLLKSIEPKKEAKRLLYYFDWARSEIARIGSKLIKNHMRVFTHCHSSSVMALLKYAKAQGKNFIVYNTETFPLYQGRQTALELSSYGIKVIHASDLGEDYTLEQSDIFLFGADAFVPEGIINKVGTSMFCELACLHKIPCYAVGNSLKFARKIEQELRPAKELWPIRKKKNLKIINPAFDFTEKRLVKGVITELGIMSYSKFARRMQKRMQ